LIYIPFLASGLVEYSIIEYYNKTSQQLPIRKDLKMTIQTITMYTINCHTQGDVIELDIAYESFNQATHACGLDLVGDEQELIEEELELEFTQTSPTTWEAVVLDEDDEKLVYVITEKCLVKVPPIPTVGSVIKNKEILNRISGDMFELEASTVDGMAVIQLIQEAEMLLEKLTDIHPEYKDAIYDGVAQQCNMILHAPR
jgi:hypothetical protein